MNRSCHLTAGSVVASTKSFKLGKEENHRKVSVNDNLLILVSQNLKKTPEGLCPVRNMTMRTIKLMKFYAISKIEQ